MLLSVWKIHICETCRRRGKEGKCHLEKSYLHIGFAGDGGDKGIV